MTKHLQEIKATYARIAEEANVSVATVSRVIHHREKVSEETVKKVLGAMRSLGSGLGMVSKAEGKSRYIVAIVPFDNPAFSAGVVKGMKKAAKYYGYQILIKDEFQLTEENVDECIKMVEQGIAAGFLLMSVAPGDVLERLKNFAPVVQCCEYNTDVEVSHVAVDNRESTRKMTEYLLRAGKKDIVFLHVDNEYSNCSRLRKQGFEDAMREAGIEIRPEQLITLPSFEYRLAYSEIERILQNTNEIPDCIFCTSDVFASAALKVCKKRGFDVPGDIWVVGFDNIELSVMLTPALTTVNQPGLEIGYTAFKYVMEMLNDPETPVRETLLEGEIVIRESTI